MLDFLRGGGKIKLPKYRKKNGGCVERKWRDSLRKNERGKSRNRVGFADSLKM